ncbi:uncharacterized protein LOC128855254 [Anastrepha ludens]|uniref:uncharacterized protein LOC128855254 n=1 Tax=Anastrepha ludens TaxID=28586 RepID=UPI0023AE72D1|nr:uncharacterized protein LOC128855254 [Anastrepha ludens]
MSWWQQVRREVVRQQCTDDCSNYDSADMNGSNGKCSCPKQRRCNRLTCYRNSTVIGSSNREAVPLFITLTILMLAMPLIDAAAVKRSVAETTTSFEVTTSTIPSGVVDEIDFTPTITPLLADVQTTVSVNQNEQRGHTGDADAAIVNDAETTLVGTTTTQNFNQTLPLNVPQDINNEISQVSNESIATEVRVTPEFVDPKFEYTETQLTEDLEESIRNSIKNEIEFEHDIGNAAIEHRLETINQEERHEQLDEISAIQNAQLRGNTEPREAFGVPAEFTSITPVTVRYQRVTTESSSVGYSSTAETDLSIYFPVQAEERPSIENLNVGIQRDARNLNISVNENSEILKQNADSENYITADVEMQNIEEEKNENHNELVGEDKHTAPAYSNPMSEAALYSHESNEIQEAGPRLQAEVNQPQDTSDKKGKEGHENAIVGNEDKVNSEDDPIIDQNQTKVIPTEDKEALLTAAVIGNSNTTQGDHSTPEYESVDVQTEEKASSSEETPIEGNASEVIPVQADDKSLSIVLNENLTATEPVAALENDQLEELMRLEEIESLASGEIYTTVKPETLKNVHVVIKKQGVELDEEKIDSPIALTEVVEVTTINTSLVKETSIPKDGHDELETTETTLEPLVEKESVEKVQNIQNDVAIKETTQDLEASADVKISEPTENIEDRSDERNEQISAETEINQTDANHNERSEQEEEKNDDANIDTDLTTNELDSSFEEKEDALNENQYFIRLSNELQHYSEKTSATQDIASTSQTTPTEEPVITQEAEDNSIDKQSIETTEQVERMHITLIGTTHTPNIESHETAVSTTEAQATTQREFESYEDASKNTDGLDIVPILVGVSAAQGDITASTKGSRSINTQTHHSMLLTRMDDTMAATLFETFPPHDAGQTFNDHLAAESSSGIGKPLPSRSVTEATSASLLSRSGLIIVICSSIALMFLLVSVTAFLISFQRQHGTLDIEMQEQRCGKDNLDEEDEEAGTCTKLLEIELPKSSIVTVPCEEMEECL